MKKIISFLIILLLIASVLIIYGCKSSDKDTSAEKEPIKEIKTEEEATKEIGNIADDLSELSDELDNLQDDIS